MDWVIQNPTRKCKIISLFRNTTCIEEGEDYFSKFPWRRGEGGNAFNLQGTKISSTTFIVP